MSHQSSNLAEKQAQTKISVVGDKPTARKKARTVSDKDTEPAQEESAKPDSGKDVEPAEKKKARPVSEENVRPTEKKKARPVSEESVRPAGKKKARPISEENVRPAEKKKARPVSEESVRPAGKKKAEPVFEENVRSAERKKVRPISEESGKTAEKKKARPISKENVGPSAGKKARPIAVEQMEEIPVKKIKRTSDRIENQESEEEFAARMRRRDEARAKKREERRIKVRRQKIMLGVSAGVIAAAVVCVLVFCLPSLKLSRSLSKGDKYSSQADYTKAQSAYEQALKIDTASVEAYRGMADNYVAQEKVQEAKQILYTGWEQTQDEGLLHYYCVELCNEAVAEINAKNCTLATVDKCIQVLEQEAGNQDALKLLGTCYERLFQVTEDEDTCMMFSDADIAQETCEFGEYDKLLRRLLALYQADPSGEVKTILTQYALIDMPYVRISVPHLEEYTALLTDINSVVDNANITETLACLARAKEVRDYFAAAFTEFEAGNYAYARDLVAEESYQKIRDSFIEENSGYWEGSVYIPISKEQFVLHREDGKVRFSFLGEKEYENHQGIIAVWGTKQEDDGVQRSVISYMPAAEEGADSYTEYTVQYLYSNVKIDGEYVPQMNYRFDTKVTTEEGITTNAIGDWGGEHEWEIDY